MKRQIADNGLLVISDGIVVDTGAISSLNYI